MARPLMDADTIRRLVERYEQPLCRYAMRFTRDAELARDAVQETFLRLCREDKRFDSTNHVSAWLFRVCRSRATDRIRKEARMNAIPGDAFARTAAGDAGPAQAAVERETASRLLDALSSLPAEQQEVIRLKFQENMSYREIAEVTALTVSNVGYLIHHGMKALRQAVV